MVNIEQRYRRLRLLTKRLNKERKQQAKKIDILCNDFIAAQKDFIRKFNIISFTASFYESIIGTTDLNNLLYTTVALIRKEFEDAYVTFFLRQRENFELHIFENTGPVTFDEQHLENCFSAELMDNICNANKICNLDDMFAMGLQGNLAGLNRISAVTIPLGRPGSSLGFILIYLPSENGLSANELDNICAVTSGLSRAVQSCRELLHPAD